MTWVDISHYGAFLRTKVLSDARRLHLHFSETGHDTLPAVGNLIVKMYGNCGSVEQAAEVFDRTQGRNQISWNILLTAFAQNGYQRDARQIFDKMPCRGIASWNSIVSCYSQSGQLHQACHLFERMPERNVITWNVLLAAFARKGHHYRRELVFERMPARNLISWNSIIISSADGGDIDRSKRVFDEMPGREAATWNTMLTAFASNGYLDEAAEVLRLQPQQTTMSWNSVLTGYAESGRLQEAEQMFAAFPVDDVISWSIMIAAYAHSGQGNKALQLFREMNHRGLSGDMITFCSVLDACATATSSGAATGRLVHAMIEENGIIADVRLSTSLVNMYARCGNLVKARAVFEEIGDHRDLVTWNAMISAYTNTGQENAFQLFSGMVMHGHEPGYITFISLLSACGHAGMVEAGRARFFSISSDYFMKPTLEHYRCMVDLLARTGQLELAELLVYTMPYEPDGMTWNVLLSAAKTYGDVARAARATKSAEPDASGYVLFASAMSGR